MKLQKRCIKAARRQPHDDENSNDDQKEDNGIHAAHGSTTSTDAKTSSHNGEQLESRPVTQTDVDQCSTDDKFDCVEGITADEEDAGCDIADKCIPPGNTLTQAESEGLLPQVIRML